MKYLILVVVVLNWISSTHSLSCMPCEETECRNVTCNGTVVKDVCGCCPACAKQRGERCGGPWNIGGVCDEKLNLTCIKFGPPEDLKFNLHGTCQPKRFEGICSYPHTFSECASACQPNCDVRNPAICTLNCAVEKCVCGPGFIRRSGNNKTCIPLEECPAQRCEFPKIFSTCATACPRTCGNPYPFICTKNCYSDPCICPEGYFMRSLTDRRCILPYECEDFSFCDKSCPPLDVRGSSCQVREAWSCWLDVWKCNTYKWKMGMERWWRESCDTSEMENLWEDLPECSDDSEEIRCTNPDMTERDLDAFGCSLLRCADGKYEDPRQLLAVWKRSSKLSMALTEVYNKARESCVGVRDEC